VAHHSKRRTSRSKRRLKNQKNSAVKLVRLELNAKALSEAIAGRRAILPSLPNMQDNVVVQKLSTAKIGNLPVDDFARLFCKDGGPPRKSDIVALRLGLIRVYFVAANARLYARTSEDQLKSAQAALTSLTRAIEQLDQVGPPRQACV